MEAQLAGSPKLGKKEKRRYQVDALHRRAVSQIEGCRDVSSEEEERVGRSLGDGRHSSYNVARKSQGSKIRFLNR